MKFSGMKARTLRCLLSLWLRGFPPTRCERRRRRGGERPLFPLAVSTAASFGVSSLGPLLPLALELVFDGLRLQR